MEGKVMEGEWRPNSDAVRRRGKVPGAWKPHHGGAPQNTHLERLPPVTQVSGSLKSERR